jgi:uncharacterized coiled-coil protein SlyX
MSIGNTMIDQELRTHVGNLLTDIKDAMNQRNLGLAAKTAARLAALLADYSGGGPLMGNYSELAELKQSRADWKCRFEAADREGYDVARARDVAKARIAELEKQLADTNARIEELSHDSTHGKLGMRLEEVWNERVALRERVALLTTDLKNAALIEAAAKENHSIVVKQLAESANELAAARGRIAELGPAPSKVDVEEWRTAPLDRGEEKEQGSNQAKLLTYRDHTLRARVEALRQSPLNPVPDSAPAPDHHNARRLAWREYVTAAVACGPSTDVLAWADRLVAEEEKRFGEIK